MNPLILTLFVGLFTLGGVILGTFIKNNKKLIDFSIGIALGVIGALIILELIPEAYEHLEMSSHFRSILMLVITSAIGFLVMNILDKFVPHHHHESTHEHNHKDNECYNSHLSHIGILATIALLLHNVIEGMTLYVAATASMEVGYLLCLGIGLHNIPMGIIIAGTLNGKKQVFISTMFLVFSSFIGGVVMNIINPINSFLVGVFISLTLGMLIYIAINELLMQIIHSKNKKINILGVVTGVIILVVSLFVG